MNTTHPAAPVAEHTGATPAALAMHIAGQLRGAIAARGHALLAVSGGKSPIALFEVLRTQPLNWDKVTVLLVDERIVPHDHADSNTALVRRHLLQDAAAAASFAPFFDSVPDRPDDATMETLAGRASQRLAALPWPLDVAVLGMGEDGHTASLFPAAPGLAQALRASGPVAWVRPATAPHARLTLTLPALLASRALLLSIAGAAKLAVYRQARQAADPALPVSLLLNQHEAPVSVWIA